MADDQFVSTVAKVKREPEDLEEVNETTPDGTTQPTEQVVEDSVPGDTIHTEGTEPEDRRQSNEQREDLRQDFMDRVNEDIENADSEE